MIQDNQISLENVLRRCGDFSRYQWIHYVFLNLIAICNSINAFYYVFGVAEPLFRCRLPSTIWPDEDQFESINTAHKQLIDNWQSSTARCETINRTTCTDFVYDRTVFGKTFTEEANLICTHAVKRTWLSTALQLGTCTALISGLIGDKIGRKRIIQILTILQVILIILTQLLLQFVSMSVDSKFGLLLFNQFMSTAGAFSMTFLLLMELTSSTYTTLAGNLALISFTLAEIFTTVFAYLARDWLKLKWFNSGFYAITLFYLYFVPESPYWLFNRKKFTELETCLRTIATTNGHADAEWLPYLEELIKSLPVTQEGPKHVRIKTRINPRMLMRLSASGCIGFVTMLLYIKISYGLASMESTLNPYWNIIIGAVVEGIGYVSASILMVTRLGRKFSMLFYALLTSVCVIIIPFVLHTNPLVVVIVSQIGKLTISGAVSVSWIYVPELFPTSMRGFGNAVLVVFGRVGAILAPIIDATLGDRYIRITFYVYSVLGLVIVGLLFILPETRNRSFDSHDESHNNLAASNIHINEVVIENPSYDASTHY